MARRKRHSASASSSWGLPGRFASARNRGRAPRVRREPRVCRAPENCSKRPFSAPFGARSLWLIFSNVRTRLIWGLHHCYLLLCGSSPIEIRWPHAVLRARRFSNKSPRPLHGQWPPPRGRSTRRRCRRASPRRRRITGRTRPGRARPTRSSPRPGGSSPARGSQQKSKQEGRDGKAREAGEDEAHQSPAGRLGVLCVAPLERG